MISAVQRRRRFVAIGLWLLGSVSFIAFGLTALVSMRDPATAFGLLFGGFASLFAFGWMAEMLKGVDKIQDLLKTRFADKE
jgi:hypothetical protein